MSVLYVTENNAVISVNSNYMEVKISEDMSRKIPLETLESISIFSRVRMTTPCIEECLKRGVPVAFYSKYGSYFGRLESTGHISAQRQRKQAQLYHTEFALELGKRILSAKIKNQEVVLKRYSRNRQEDISGEVKMMNISYSKLEQCQTIEELIGYEGNAAKYYFRGLSKLVEEEWKFDGRSKRPPKDEFNSMLSLGYSILMNEIYGKIQNKGLNPYFGFIHQDKEKHPTLASDLMEEWRAVIVDSVVMSLVNGHEIQKSHFEQGMDRPGFFLTNEGMKIFVKKLEAKIHTDTRYLPYVDYSVSFRRGIEMQMGQLVKAIEEEDAALYMPIHIR